MIKGILKDTGGDNAKDVIFFGLTRNNVNRLMQGEPILVDLAEIGLPSRKVVIHFGETEEAIVDEMRRSIPTFAFKPVPESN